MHGQGNRSSGAGVLGAARRDCCTVQAGKILSGAPEGLWNADVEGGAEIVSGPARTPRAHRSRLYRPGKLGEREGARLQCTGARRSGGCPIAPRLPTE